jgi:geranylgeranyl diphosphate synthase type II
MSGTASGAMSAADAGHQVAAGDAAFVADRAAVALALDAFLARYLGDDRGPVADAIRYSVGGEGKRLRAILVMEAYRAAGGTGDVTALAAAVEVVHAYSLVHDDLPCMDDDDMRRGRPTVHRAYGVRVATAAGMAMVPLAAQASADAARELGLAPPARAEVVRTLMRASGAGGMIGGQLLDLEGEGLSLSLEQLERIHRLKTGALIEASMVLGGLAAGASDAMLGAFARYGAAVGLAFQITDDVLDITGTTDQLGKTAGKDAQFRKSTYPALLGIDGATARAESLVAEAREALRAQGALTPELDALARFTVARTS